MRYRNFTFIALALLAFLSFLWLVVFAYVTNFFPQYTEVHYSPPDRVEGLPHPSPETEKGILSSGNSFPTTGETIGGSTVVPPIPPLNSEPIEDTKVPEKVTPRTPSAPSTSTPQQAHEELVLKKVGALNQQDIFFLTNAERIKEGVAPLTFSARLSAIAEAKVVDMIEKQYFEHVSPSGVGIKRLSEIYGYEYITVGENLALGHFTDSAHVVQGWMNSPGHKANILKPDYTEIGISALPGNYEGQEVWFAVQEFGRPLSDCPAPDTKLEQKIIIFNTQLKTLGTTLENLKKDMEIGSVAERNEKIKDYNTIVALFNDILEITKNDMEIFNTSVREYNACIENA